MTEAQANDLINAIGELTNAVESIGGKGQMGYTIADSLEELALQFWHDKEVTPAKVQTQIDDIVKSTERTEAWLNS